MGFLDNEDIIVETDIDIGKDKHYKAAWKNMLEELRSYNASNLIYNEDLYKSNTLFADYSSSLGYQTLILIPLSLIKKCLVNINYIRVVKPGVQTKYTLCIFGYGLDKEDSYDSLFDEYAIEMLKDFKGLLNLNIEEVLLFGTFKDLDILNKMSTMLIDNLGLSKYQVRVCSSSRILEDDDSKNGKVAYKIMQSLSKNRLVLNDFECNIFYKLFPITLEHAIKKVKFDINYGE